MEGGVAVCTAGACANRDESAKPSGNWYGLWQLGLLAADDGIASLPRSSSPCLLPLPRPPAAHSHGELLLSASSRRRGEATELENATISETRADGILSRDARSLVRDGRGVSTKSCHALAWCSARGVRRNLCHSGVLHKHELYRNVWESAPNRIRTCDRGSGGWRCICQIRKDYRVRLARENGRCAPKPARIRVSLRRHQRDELSSHGWISGRRGDI
mmetsp:Transcript_3866/g.8697  ORF Transcript_3866/g.8697 Transcript_3866/m.8697 type:complete len:217 (-) Transcript_3866:577-1227(-)